MPGPLRSPRHIAKPNARVSGYPRHPGTVMGPGPTVGKPQGTPPEETIFFGPISGLGFSSFSEVYKRSIRGNMHGKLIVGADVAVSIATVSQFTVLPFLYVDIQIVGWTNGVQEVLAYGATGMSLSAGTPITQDNGNMDAPVVEAEWDDSFGFDDVSVNIRTMGNGGVPFDNNFGAPLWLPATSPHNILMTVTTGGVLGVAQFAFNIDGGTQGAPIVSSGLFFVPGTTTRVTPAAGTYVLGTTYTINTQGQVSQNGPGPTVTALVTGTGDEINVNISGKLWR